ncbi:Norsolorinic acid ketoreductase [Lachnellula suecica]|uniref:Norsolorinic acid ketoreductase n=1 Tax=Lachnellula suecica TaxID=602035 RepID=A0A8T9CG21_9HELO|nr:Norsolorinic acid ketoreductase [Lachnellula suecica]
MSSNTTYLVTGGNRGLGLGFVKTLLARPNAAVIAGVRDPSRPSSQALSELPVGNSSSLIIVKIESDLKESVLAAMQDLQKNHGINSLDVVIANAGIANNVPTVAEADLEELKEHFLVNTAGVVGLFQAVLPLLNQSQKQKMFVAISSNAACIGDLETRNFPNAVYGPSKAALNHLVKRIHLEHKDITAFPVHPGWVQTDMGNAGAVKFGLEKAELTVDESVGGVVKLIDGATKQETSGRFWNYLGGQEVW